MTTLHRCDGTRDGKPCGDTQPGRGKAQTLPAGWVHVAIDGRGMDLCLKCEMARRAEGEGAKR